MDLGINGKLALVMASSDSMERNVADTLATEGANLVIFSRSDEKLRSVCHEMEVPLDLVTVTVPQMMDRGWGRIVEVTSGSAEQPMAGHALSTVFRAGVTAYMQGLAAEVAPHGITVNCVAPALIDTSHRQGKAADTKGLEEHRKTPKSMGRMGTHDECCGVIAFLASRQAGIVTGSTVAVEGSMMASIF
jgi:3-oxoacyl-[acyl-carrier protein] reductase